MIPVSWKYLALLFALSLVYTGLLNRFNNRVIRQQNPDNIPSNTRSLVFNSTVYSVDNYWYVNQVKNLIEHGRFTVDIQKDRYEVRRTPVYPAFFGLHYWLFGEENGYRVIRYTQAVILALAVVALFLAVFYFTGDRRAAWFSAILYGAFPLIPVSSNFTMTEALSSELVCFCLLALSLAWRHNRKTWWFLGGFTLALAALCRPTIIFLAVPVAGLLWMANKRQFGQFVINGLIFSAGVLLLIAPWAIRNYRVTGDLVLLEKYYGDPMDYGMPNIHLRHWIACWNNPADYTSEHLSNIMRENLMYREPRPSDSLIRDMVDEMPDRAFTGSSRDGVSRALHELYDYYAGQFRGLGRDEQARLETMASSAFIRLRENYIHSAPFGYYVVRNAIFLKSIVFQSNASSLAFLDDYTSRPLRKLGRIAMYVISVLSWLSLLFLVPWGRAYAAFYGLAFMYALLSVGVSIAMIAYYEARYSVPLFPLLFGCLAIWLSRIVSLARTRFTST